MSYNYRQINYEVMVDTSNRCKKMQELKEAIEHSIANQLMIAEEENIDQPLPDKVTTKYIVSGKRSFEAAKGYAGKK